MVTVLASRHRTAFPAFVWIYCHGREVQCDVDQETGEAFCPSCGRSFKVTW